jgi:hypothetical protein
MAGEEQSVLILLDAQAEAVEADILAGAAHVDAGASLGRGFLEDLEGAAAHLAQVLGQLFRGAQRRGRRLGTRGDYRDGLAIPGYIKGKGGGGGAENQRENEIAFEHGRSSMVVYTSIP